MKRYDLVVVGSGAGLVVLETALAQGLSCALVERSKFGGTCLTRGCIPSKMLVFPADLIRETQQSDRIGLKYPSPEVDWSKISDRMWQKINYSRQIQDGMKSVNNLDVYVGTGRFTGTHAMEVLDQDGKHFAEFQAVRFVLAPGARTFIPPIKGIEEADCLTTESFFGEKYPKTPWKSLIIVGGGAIGAEFAHIFSAFGTKVTVVEMKSRILATEEEEISLFVQEQYKSLGIEVMTHHQAISVDISSEGKVLVLEDSFSGDRRSIQAEEILIASGLKSNADTLQLEKAGVAVDARGWIETDDYLETSANHIFAIGDVNGLYQFRHKANYEAEILVKNLFGSKRVAANYSSVPWAVFTWPQVAHVGLTEREAQNRGFKVWVGRNHYSDVAAGSAMGYDSESFDNGFVKIVVNEDKKILGAHIVGPHAAILVQPFVYLMNSGYQCRPEESDHRNLFKRKTNVLLQDACRQMGTIKPVLDSMVIHPSLSELTAWALAGMLWENHRS